MSRTDDQQSIVDERNKNIIVSAAAGSGKTKVLVDRIIELVAEGADIDSMLIVTFTNKASAEMKGRIQTNLEQAYKMALENKADNAIHLRDQVKKLRTTHIQTLHAFCADMLRENFYEAGISPNFKILDDRKSKILKADALDELFDYRYENLTDEFRLFINNFSKTRDDENAKYVVSYAYDKIMDQIYPDQAKEIYFSQSSSMDDYRMYIKDEYDKLLKDIDEFLESQNFIGFCELKNFFLAEMDAIKKAYKKVDWAAITDERWDDFIDDTARVYFANLRSFKGEKPDEKSYDEIKTARNNIKSKLSDISIKISPTKSKIYKKFEEKEKAILKELVKLVDEFEDIYKAKKEEISGLDFNDLEHRFVELINNSENNTLEHIRDQFAYIFFDEYQDANDTQNYIVEKISRPDNLFFVGDVKQSIYGFRRANPDLFINRLETYKDPSNELSTRIDLSQNFRTEKDILTFNNYIFERLMTKDQSGIDYLDGHQLNFYKDNDDTDYKVVLDIVRKKNTRSKDEAEKARRNDLAYKAVAHRVKDLVENSTYKVTEKDGEEEKIVEHNYQYKDILILLRGARGKAHLYENALRDAGIPVVNEIINPDIKSVEVNFFIDILKYLANPFDDITLLSVIRSEIFGFTEDDIAKIRLFGPNRNFYKAFDEYSWAYDDERLDEYKNNLKEFYDEDLSNRVSDFITKFDQLRYESNLMNLADFGSYIFENTGYYNFLRARDRADERTSNVENVIELMADFDQANENGLFGFLKYYDDLERNNTNDLSARGLTDNENFVRIMTVHKSKGLESKAIILANAEKEMDIQEVKKSYAFHPNIGFGFRLVDEELMVKVPSINYSLIINRLREENLREEMRILYVALTRAENKLVISQELEDYKNTLEEVASKDYLDLNSHSKWLLKALNDAGLKPSDKSTYITNDLGNIVKVNLLSDDIGEDKGTNKLDDILNKEMKLSYYDKLSKYYKAYTYENATTDPIKRTVTEISKNFNKQIDDDNREGQYFAYIPDFDIRKPDFLTERIEYRPMEKGTIIHKVFQNVPVRYYTEEELVEELDNLIANYKLSQDEVDLIEIDKLLYFYRSDVVNELSEGANAIINEESFLMKYEYGKADDDFYYIDGQIDLMIEYDDHFILLDFKTDKEKRVDAYKDQLARYKEAIMKSKGNKEVRESIIYWYNFKEFTKY